MAIHSFTLIVSTLYMIFATALSRRVSLIVHDHTARSPRMVSNETLSDQIDRQVNQG